MKNLIYILFTITLIAISCTKNYTIDINNIDKRMVLYSVFNTDSIFTIKITEESNLSENVIGENSFKKINDADIYIYTMKKRLLILP